jgi:hypothetical protein
MSSMFDEARDETEKVGPRDSNLGQQPGKFVDAG